MKPSYEELEAKCNSLTAKLSAINGLMDAAEQANKLAQEATKKLVQERDSLAAELSAVDAIHNDAVFITDEHYEQCPPEAQKIIGALAVLQIPAYESFLAEVRAQGVDVAIEHLINKFECTGRIGVPVMSLEWLARELRKGAQS